MDKQITLIAGFGDALSLALAEAAARRSRTVVLALGRANASTEGGEAALPAGVERVAYRPGSALSARGILLEAQAGRGQVTELIIALEPRTERAPALDGDPRTAEAFLDEGPKAWLQLIRESARYFRKTGSGAIIFCVPGSGWRSRADEGPPGLYHAEGAMLEALADSCLAESTAELPVYAFSGPATDWNAYAEAVLDALDKRGSRRSGRWTKAGAVGLFGFGRSR